MDCKAGYGRPALGGPPYPGRWHSAPTCHGRPCIFSSACPRQTLCSSLITYGCKGWLSLQSMGGDKCSAGTVEALLLQVGEGGPGCQTVGGKSCVFPFTYRRQTFHQCTTVSGAMPPSRAVSRVEPPTHNMVRLSITETPRDASHVESPCWPSLWHR